MTESMVPAPDDDPAVAEIGSALHATLQRSMGGTLKEWRTLLAEAQQKYDRAAWKPADERVSVEGLLEYTRWALDAFERIGCSGGNLEQRRPADLTWHDVSAAWMRDAAAGRAVWDRIKQTAKDELAVGAASGRAIEGYQARPIERAEYLAIWQGLADGLKPANGAERLLIDAMAQALLMHRRWLQRHVETDSLEIIRGERNARYGEQQLPRLSEVEAVDRAAMMADRFQRAFLRLLKSYRDQRRLFSTLVVAGGQVNIAGDGGQQVNVASRTMRAGPRHINPKRRIRRKGALG